jgi:hypothetical protein
MARGDVRPGANTRRYHIHVPVWYRTRYGHWHEGRTVDMSASGALIRTSDPVPPVGTPIRLRVVLPGDPPWTGPQIASAGRVVGTRPAGHGDQQLLTVALSTSRLKPVPCAPDLGTRGYDPKCHEAKVTAERGGRGPGRTVNRTRKKKR